MGLPISEGFVGCNLKRDSQAKLSLQRKYLRTRILSKSAKPSSSRSRRFGRPSKPTVFGRQYQKNRILKPAKNRSQPAEKRRYQKNTPLNCTRWFRPDKSAFDLLEFRGPYDSNYALSPKVVSRVTNTAHQEKKKQTTPLNSIVCAVNQLFSF